MASDQYDEGQRWLDFAKGALLFLMVLGDDEPGTFYLYDRGRPSFYPLSLPIEQRYGGFREEEFESLTNAFDLVALAGNPRVLRPSRALSFLELSPTWPIKEKESSDGPPATRHGLPGRIFLPPIRESPCVLAAIHQASPGHRQRLLLSGPSTPTNR